MIRTRKIQHLRDLYDVVEKDLANVEVQIWLYQREVDKPENIGKEQAMQNLEVYQKRATYLEQNLAVYKLYAKEFLKIEL